MLPVKYFFPELKLRCRPYRGAVMIWLYLVCEKWAPLIGHAATILYCRLGYQVFAPAWPFLSISYGCV